jgi:hypothetical protein
MRFAGFIFFLLATVLMSLLDGLGATVAALVLCTIGSVLISSRQLAELAAEEEEHPPVRVSVVRWNY